MFGFSGMAPHEERNESGRNSREKRRRKNLMIKRLRIKKERSFSFQRERRGQAAYNYIYPDSSGLRQCLDNKTCRLHRDDYQLSALGVEAVACHDFVILPIELRRPTGTEFGQGDPLRARCH